MDYGAKLHNLFKTRMVFSEKCVAIKEKIGSGAPRLPGFTTCFPFFFRLSGHKPVILYAKTLSTNQKTEENEDKVVWNTDREEPRDRFRGREPGT